MTKHRLTPAESLSAMTTTELSGRISGTLVWTKPMRVVIEQAENGDYIISDDVLLVWGTGHAQEEAIEDYLRSIAEFYTLTMADDEQGLPKETVKHLIGERHQ